MAVNLGKDPPCPAFTVLDGRRRRSAATIAEPVVALREPSSSENWKARRRTERRLQRQRERQAHKLRRAGAREIASTEELLRSQAAMLARFESAGVPDERWRRLRRCRPGRCGKKTCSAACWFGDRALINDMMLQAAELLSASEKPLRFVTIIDPLHFTPIGKLNDFSMNGLMQSLRRRFRAAGALFEDDPAVGVLEVAVEVNEAGEACWSPHIHIVMATKASPSAIRAALRPGREPPNPALWGRQRWRLVDVQEVTDLANLLAYNSKRQPEQNARGYDRDGRRVVRSQRVPAAHRLEHDLWMLLQRPSDRIFLRRMKRVHGRLTSMGGQVTRVEH